MFHATCCMSQLYHFPFPLPKSQCCDKNSKYNKYIFICNFALLTLHFALERKRTMPIIKSAKKYMRVSARKNALNKIIRGSFRSAIKKTREAVASQNVGEAKKWLAIVVKALDKAAQKKVIKKNAAARKKSRLNKLVKSLTKK